MLLFSCWVVSDSLQPHGLQHVRLPCPWLSTWVSIKLVMLPNHLILCHPLLLLPSIFPSIRVFSNKSALRIRCPKYWSFSFSISPSSEHPGWLPLGWTSFMLVICILVSFPLSETLPEDEDTGPCVCASHRGPSIVLCMQWCLWKGEPPLGVSLPTYWNRQAWQDQHQWHCQHRTPGLGQLSGPSRRLGNQVGLLADWKWGRGQGRNSSPELWDALMSFSQRLPCPEAVTP